MALYWAADGTDVDFGVLAKQLIGYCLRNGGTALFGHEVRNLTRQRDGSWTLAIHNLRTGEKRKLNAKFVFIGAGGYGSEVGAAVSNSNVIAFNGATGGAIAASATRGPIAAM